MLHSAGSLMSFTVHGTDGEVGSVDDVYFDDDRWVVRYVVVDTGGWLSGRKVLLSPLSFHRLDWDARTLTVDLTRDRIRSSPGIETHKPVSRQQESELFRHYDYPYYWAGPYAWGFSVSPVALDPANLDNRERAEARDQVESSEDRHLRSCREVKGYAIHARDDTLGHLEDLLFDEADWSIRMVVIDPRDWWPGKHVLVAPERIVSVDWADKSVTVDMRRAEVESSQAYDPENPPPSPPPAARRETGAHPGR